MNTQKQSIFMQMHNGTRTGEGSFYTGLQKLFYDADNANRHKLVKAFPDFFGESVPEFGIYDQQSTSGLKQPTSCNVLESYIKQDSEAALFFNSYNERQLSEQEVKEYCANAAILNAVKRIIDERNAIRKMCGAKVTSYWPSISQYIMNLDRTNHPHSLPMNERRLRDKFQAYQDFGYVELIRPSRLSNMCN